MFTSLFTPLGVTGVFGPKIDAPYGRPIEPPATYFPPAEEAVRGTAEERGGRLVGNR